MFYCFHSFSYLTIRFKAPVFLFWINILVQLPYGTSLKLFYFIFSGKSYILKKNFYNDDINV